MLTGGTGDRNLQAERKHEESPELMLSRVRSHLVFSVEHKGTKVSVSKETKKSDIMMDRWKSIFSKYDSEGAGTLRRQDIRRMVRIDLKVPERLVTDEDILTIFTALDLDEGGTVDFQEFLNFVQQPSTRGTITDQDVVNSVARAVRISLMKNKVQIKDLEANFRSFDESGDVSTGELGPNDMVRYFRKMLKITKHDSSDKALRTAFYAMDDDGSGKMSLEELMEFIRFCSVEHNQKPPPTRVPGLIGGMRGQLPRRVPSSRPGSFSGVPMSRIPFCLNGRDIDPAGRLAQSGMCGLVRSASDPGLSPLREINQQMSQELSTTASIHDLVTDVHADEEARPVSSQSSPTKFTGSPQRKKKVWSGKFPGDSTGGYMNLKGAAALNKVEDRLFEAGIDVRGRYHTLGRIRIQAWN